MEEAHEILVARLGEESGELRARLEDAFEPERVRYELTLELVDSTEAVLRRLVRPAWEEIDLRGARFTLTPGTHGGAEEPPGSGRISRISAPPGD